MRSTSIIQLIYGVPGIFTYFIVLSAMVAQKKILSKSFIVIFAITGAINGATWINSWIRLRLKREAFMEQFYEWAAQQFFFNAALAFLVQQFYFAQNTCVLLLTLDRFAVIYSINRKTEVWRKSYVFVTVLAQSLCVILNIGTRLLFNGQIRADMKIEELIKQALNNPSFFQIAFGGFVFFICSILNAVSLRRLHALRGIAHASREVSFFVISLCIFFAQILNLIIYIIIAFEYSLNANAKQTPFRTIINDVMLFTSDLFSIGPGFYTLLLPGPVRRLISHTVKSTMGRYLEHSQSSVMIVV